MELRTMICVVITIEIFMLPVHSFIQMSPTWNCENKLTLNWLWNLRNNDRCVNIIIESVFVPKCIYDQIFHSKFVIKTYDMNVMKSPNILKLQTFQNCNNFMFFVRSANDTFELFKASNNRKFVPFSQLFLVIFQSKNITFDENILNYIYKHALFMYVVENTLSSSNEFCFKSLRNVLTKATLDLTTSIRKDVISFFGSFKSHPFFDNNFKQKVFRVSLFKCDPYIIYLADGTFDGIQYRMLKELGKNWIIEHNKCDFSSIITVPWNAVLYNVDDEISDLAMCSIWMNKPLYQYDTSTYFDLQCGTFLVPKPKSLNPTAYLYLSLNENDWYGFAMSLIVMTMCFTSFTKIGRKIFATWDDFVYNDFSRSLMDALNMATNHGVFKFPKEHSMKFLVTSWLIVTFIVGVGYCTRYTSLLNKPIFPKPIDTLEQLVQSDLVILVNNGDFTKNLIESGSESNIQLAKHVFLDNDTINPTIRVKQIDKQAVFVKVILKNYIGEINNMTDPQYRLRIMKTCILNQYTVVALKKHSSYTQYISEKIRLLQENGLISYWGLSIEGTNNKYIRPYFTDFSAIKEEPKKLSIGNLSGAFLLLLIGLGAAVLSYICESIYRLRK